MKIVSLLRFTSFLILFTLLSSCSNQKYTTKKYIQKNDILKHLGNDHYVYQGIKFKIDISKWTIGFNTADRKEQQEILNKIFGNEAFIEEPVKNKNISYVTLKNYQKFNKNSFFKNISSNTNINFAYPSLSLRDTYIGVTDEFYVKLKPSTTLQTLTELAKNNNCTIVKQDDYLPYVYHLKVDKSNNLSSFAVAQMFYQTGFFEYAQPNFLSIIPTLQYNDPEFSKQWSINYTSKENTDLAILDAWQFTKGNPNIKIAVLDVGVDTLHEDLKKNLILPGFDATGGGSNGHIGSNLDVHGTQIAGLIAAEANNNKGIVGIAHQSKIVPLKIGSTIQGGGAIILPDNAANAINWAWQNNNVDVYSCSWGWPPEYAYLLNIVTDAINTASVQARNGKGSLFCFATGNNGINQVMYPAYLPNVLAIGATSKTGNRAFFSQYSDSLDVVAPGQEIITTNVNNTYQEVSGTSFASPNTAAVAALILSVNESLTAAELKNIIESTTDKTGKYTYANLPNKPNGSYHQEMGYGKVNAHKAILKAIYPNAPKMVSVKKMLQPEYLNISECYSPYTAAVPIKIILKNISDTLKNGDTIELYYQINNLPAVKEKFVLTQNFNSLADTIYTFQQKANLSHPQPYTLKFWANVGNSLKHSTDTLIQKINLLPNNIQTQLPYIENFENLQNILGNNVNAYKVIQPNTSFYNNTDTTCQATPYELNRQYNSYTEHTAIRMHNKSTDINNKNELILVTDLSNYQTVENEYLYLNFTYVVAGNSKNHPNDSLFVRTTSSDKWIGIYDLNPEFVEKNKPLDVRLNLTEILKNKGIEFGKCTQFKFGQQDTTINNFTVFDHIELKVIPLNDLAVIDILELDKQTSEAQPLKIKIKNQGLTSYPANAIIPVSYTINNTTINENITLSETFKYQDTLHYEFKQLLNATEPNLYKISAQVNLPEDTQRANDSLKLNLCINMQMAGEYTIGANQANFTTLSEAIETLKCAGMKGNVTLKIKNGAYQEPNILIDSIAGSEIYHLTIEGENKNNVYLQPKTNNQAYLFKLEKAQNITITNLQITQTTDVYQNYFVGISIGDKSQNILIKDNHIKANYAIATYDSNTPFPIANLTIEANNIVAKNGIYLQSTIAKKLINKVLITKNNIQVSDIGIKLEKTNQISIAYNNITAYNNGSNVEDINIDLTNSDNYSINNNKLYFYSKSLKLNHYKDTNAGDMPSEIINNLLVSIKGGTNDQTAIWLNNDNVMLHHNTIVLNANKGVPTALFMQRPSKSQNVEIMNNSFSVFYPGGNCVGFYTEDKAINIKTFDHNHFYVAGSNNLFYVLDANNYDYIGFYNLTSFKAAYTNYNQNSVSGNPEFVTSNDYRIKSTSPLKDKGFLLPTITKDFADKERDTQPDIGAYEYDPTAQTPEMAKPIEQQISVFPNPFHKQLSVQINNTQQQQFHLTIQNLLGQTIYQRTYNQNISLIKDDFVINESGTYFLKIITNKGVYATKLIAQ